MGNIFKTGAIALLGAWITIISGCGGNTTPVGITVNPPNPTILLGKPVLFTAVVSGTATTSVTWQICLPPSPTVLGDKEVSVGSAAPLMVTVACPCFDGSAAETAVIVTAPDGATAGAKYSPAVQFAGTDSEEVGQINPSAVDPPATPFTSQVTFDPLAVPPFTLARNCWCSPTARDAEVGVTVTPMPELIVTTVDANAVDRTVLVATTKNPLVGGNVVGAV